MELSEWLDQVDVDHLIVFQVEAGEQGLVEHASLLVVAAKVQGLWILQQCDACLDQFGAESEIVLRLAEPLDESPALALDLLQLDLDLLRGAGGEVGEAEGEQVVLPGVQGVQLGRELLVQ